MSRVFSADTEKAVRLLGLEGKLGNLETRLETITANSTEISNFVGLF